MKSCKVKNNVLALSLFVLYLVILETSVFAHLNPKNEKLKVESSVVNRKSIPLLKSRKEISNCSIPNCKYPDSNCDICLKCSEGFDTLNSMDNSLISKKSCYPILKDCNLYNMDGTCKECQKDFMLLSYDGKGSCQKCKSTNENGTSCTTCHENYFLIEGKCVNFENCLKLDQNNQCQQCSENNFLNAETKRCYTKSKGCINNIVIEEVLGCTKCDDTFVNVNNQCVSKIPNCNSHDFSSNKAENKLVCLVCDSDYEVSMDGKCSKTNCQKFSQGFCEKCKEGYELDEKTKKCRKIIEKCLFQADGICIKCDEGFEYSNFKCVKTNCKVFEKSQNDTQDEVIKLRILKRNQLQEKTLKKKLSE